MMKELIPLSVDKLKLVVIFRKSLFSDNKEDLKFKTFTLLCKSNQVIIYQNTITKETIELRSIDFGHSFEENFKRVVTMNIDRFKNDSVSLKEVNEKLTILFNDLSEAKLINTPVPLLDSIEIKFDFLMNKKDVNTFALDAIEHAQRAVLKELFGGKNISGKLYRSYKDLDEEKRVLTRHCADGITLVKQRHNTNYFAFLFYNKTVEQNEQNEPVAFEEVRDMDVNLYRVELRFYKSFFIDSIKKKESSKDRKELILRLISLFKVKLREEDRHYKNRFINSLIKQLKRISCETVCSEIYKESETSGLVLMESENKTDYLDARRAFT